MNSKKLVVADHEDVVVGDGAKGLVSSAHHSKASKKAVQPEIACRAHQDSRTSAAALHSPRPFLTHYCRANFPRPHSSGEACLAADRMPADNGLVI